MSKTFGKCKMVCRFFGHKDAPASIAPALENDIKYLIQERDVDEFLIGNHGNFDSMAYCVLKGSITNHPHITFHVVLAYMPKESAEPSFYEYWGPPLSEEIEKVPPKVAISWRNKWMVRETDICVYNVKHSWGGAAQYME